MIHVLSHVVEVVVLPSGADALLAVHNPTENRQRTRRVGLAQEYRFELVVNFRGGGTGVLMDMLCKHFHEKLAVDLWHETEHAVK